jgi:hypothetical protein
LSHSSQAGAMPARNIGYSQVRQYLTHTQTIHLY